MLPFDLKAAQIVFWCVRVFFGTQNCPDVTKQKLLLIWSKKLQLWKAMKEVKSSHHSKWPSDCNYLHVLFICFNLFLKGLETPMLSIPICEILPQSLSLSAPQLLSLPSCASTLEILGGGDPHIEIQSGICRSKSNLLFFLIKLGVESREQSYKYKYFRQCLCYEVMHSPKKFHKDIQCLVDHIRKMNL